MRGQNERRLFETVNDAAGSIGLKDRTRPLCLVLETPSGCGKSAVLEMFLPDGCIAHDVCSRGLTQEGQREAPTGVEPQPERWLEHHTFEHLATLGVHFRQGDLSNAY